MIGHRSPVSGVDAWGRLIATAGYDNQTILWDAPTRRHLAAGTHEHLVNQCRFSSDGRFLATASSDYLARIWAVPSLESVAVLSGHSDDVEMISWSPSDELLASASRDHRIRIFAPSGDCLRTIEGHEADVLSVEWLAGGTELLSSSDDGTIRRWSVRSGEELERYDLGGETDTVVHAGDGVLLAGNDRGEILTLRAGKVRALPCHDAGIKRLVFHPHKRRLLSASYDRRVKLWTVRGDGALNPIAQMVAPAQVWLRSAAFMGHDALVFGTFGTSYATCSLADQRWDLDGVEETPGLNAACVSDGATWSVGDAGVVWRDGEVVISLGSLCNFLVPWAGTVVTGGQLGELYDARTGAVLHRHRSPLNCAAVLPLGDRLVVGAYTGEALVFERRGSELRHVLTRQVHANAVKGLACNGDRLFSVCADAAAAIHEGADLSRVRAIAGAHDRIANGAAPLPDGRFVSVSRDRTLRIWSRDGVRIVQTPHDHSVKCVAVLGGVVCTGAYDGTIGLYHHERDGWEPLRRLSRFGISSLAADPGTGELVASSYDGRLYTVRPAGRLA